MLSRVYTIYPTFLSTSYGSTPPSSTRKRVIDGRRRAGSAKLGRCVFIAPISPLFTVPAAFRRPGLGFIVRPFYFSLFLSHALSPFSHRHDVYDTRADIFLLDWRAVNPWLLYAPRFISPSIFLYLFPLLLTAESINIFLEILIPRNLFEN